MDYLIAGPRDACERVRVWFEARETPTDPCKGPHYYRRTK
jgi:hypothetical protein